MKYIFSLFILSIFVTPFAGIVSQAESANDCKVLSAEWSQSGDMPSGWFKEEGTPIDIITKTQGCVGQELNLSIFEGDTCGIECDDDLVGFYRRPILVPTDNFSVRIGLGEDECEAGATGSIGYDCHLFFYWRNNAMDLLYNSWHKVSGDLFYECDGLCDTDPILVSIIPNGNTTTRVSVDPNKSTGVHKEVYNLLAPIGDLRCIDDGSGTPGTNCVKGGAGVYLNTIFKIAIGLAAALAVVMIVIHSVSYMGDESVFGRTEAKSNILSAIGGLLLALGAYALLNTINPALTGVGGVQIDTATAEIEGDSDTPIGGTALLPSSIICSGGKNNIPNIAKSFERKMTYSQEIPKGKPGPSGTIKLDCSGFVNYVLKCAGVPFIQGGTATIFNGAERVKSISGTRVNNKELQVGDLLGWRPYDTQKYGKNGHVLIYIGNGVLADSHAPAGRIGQAYGNWSIEKYKPYITYIRRAQ